MILFAQIAALSVMGASVALWIRYFPYPSPLIRRVLPKRTRWPEKQVRGWLANGGFAPAFLTFFTRDPERVVPDTSDMLAPADGLVTSMESRGGTRYIVIALSFWDVHVQRSPLRGHVVSIEPLGNTHTDGEGRNFAFLRDKSCPIQTRIVMVTGIGPIAIRLITSLAARRIETWIDVGAQVERGQKIGRILLGSTVVLELPEDYVINITHRQRVWAGITPVARVEKRRL